MYRHLRLLSSSLSSSAGIFRPPQLRLHFNNTLKQQQFRFPHTVASVTTPTTETSTPTPSPPPHSTITTTTAGATETNDTDLTTAQALPLPGGDATRELRLQARHEILSAYSRAKLTHVHAHAKLDARDIVTTSNTVFVGVGLKSNWPGVLTALDSRAFGNRRIVIVRDVFDRNAEHRQTLSDWFSVIADDIVVVNLDLKDPIIQSRLVNVYTPSHHGVGTNANEFYQLSKSDTDFIEYLHSSGWRVITVDNQQELNDLNNGVKDIPLQQSTNHVLACAPTAFSFNQGAAIDNHFMNSGNNKSNTDDEIMKNGKKLRRKVLNEFANLHNVLIDKQNGVGAHVHLFTHEDYHNTPDACFPNNTFSTHTNLELNTDSCIVILYPMKDETRRKERRLVQRLLTRGRYTQVYDLTREEQNGTFLEGTGSLVLDRINRIAYTALSQRSDLKLAKSWAKLLNYTLVPFTSVDQHDRPIYHTNVMMTIGSNVAIICSESIKDRSERDVVVGMLKDTGHKVIDISWNQVEQFCGNVIEVESFYGQPMFVMSSGAHDAFSQQQREEMLMDGGVCKLVHADISTIQQVGGGGVRCTIAELF